MCFSFFMNIRREVRIRDGRVPRKMAVAIFFWVLTVSTNACYSSECVNADAYCEPFYGYLLYTDPVATALQIYWIRSQVPRSVVRANLDGSGITELGGTFSSSPSIMLVDGQGGFYYYNVDTSSDVRRARLDGSNDGVFATDASAGDPLGIAIDRTRNRLYFWNAANQLRYVSLVDGSGQTLLRSLTAGQIAGTYSQNDDVIYSVGGSELRRVAVDGSSETLLNNTFSNLIDVDLDSGSGLYVTALGTQEVYHINRDGTGKKVVATGFFPAGSAFDTRNKQLYICDQTNQRILRTDENGGNVVTIAALTAPYNPVACSLQFTASGLL